MNISNPNELKRTCFIFKILNPSEPNKDKRILFLFLFLFLFKSKLKSFLNYHFKKKTCNSTLILIQKLYDTWLQIFLVPVLKIMAHRNCVSTLRINRTSNTKPVLSICLFPPFTVMMKSKFK